MDIKITLDQWSAFELFCRCVARKEDIALSEFTDQIFIDSKLRFYTNKEKSLPISIDIFGETEQEVTFNDNGKKKYRIEKVPVLSTGFYEFSRKLKLAEAVSIDNEKFRKLMDYINKGISSNSKNYVKIPYKYLDHIVSSKKQQLFEGTTWYLYSDASFKEQDGNKTKEVVRVTRDVLMFKDFGKAVIKSLHFEDNLPLTYVGRYSIYGQGKNDPEGKYIKLDLKTTENERDLNIIIYIGTAKPECSFGVFRNLGSSGGSMKCGTVVIDQYNLTTAKGGEPVLLNFSDKKSLNELPDYILKYFSNPCQNLIRVPAKFTTVKAFNEWYQIQSLKRSANKNKRSVP